MNAGEAQLRQSLIGFVNHGAKTEVHGFEREIQFILSFHEWKSSYVNSIDIVSICV